MAPSTVNLTWLIPSAIKLPSILKRNLPSFPYKEDYFYYIIHIICDLMEYIDPDDQNLWVRLQSKKLQQFNQKYKKYISYLKDQGIIIVHRQYIVAEKSRGYRIASRYYSGKPIEIPIEDFIIKKKWKAILQKKKKDHSLPEYDHLTRWFNPKLEINTKGAFEKINEIFPFRGRPIGSIQGKLLRSRRSGRFKALRAIHRLQYHNFYYHVDSTIGRFHSIFTTLRKELRPFLSYDGKRLVNIDIRNSQPLLSGALLDPQFYNPQNPNFNIFKLNSLKLITKEQYYHLEPEILYSIMLGHWPETPYQKEFQQYLSIIQSGNFYEEAGKALFKNKQVNREEIKDMIFRIFFSDNRQPPSFRDKILPFIERFPTVFQIFKLIKKHNKVLLSNILQRLESQIIIEIVSRRINEENPELPIFTIHDSIVTIEGKEDYVKEVLAEEIKKCTGLNASFGVELWNS